MTNSIRPFEAKDIPLTIEGNAIKFNYPELLKIMHKTEYHEPLLKDIMSVVYNKINMCQERGINDVEVMRYYIAGELSLRLYPERAGIKQENTEQKSAAQLLYDTITNQLNSTKINNPDWNIQYVNIDEVLEQTKHLPEPFYVVDIDPKSFMNPAADDGMMKKIASKLKNIGRYATQLMDNYGFTFKEASDIMAKDSFNLDEVVTLIAKTAARTETKVKEQIIQDIHNKYTK